MSQKVVRLESGDLIYIWVINKSSMGLVIRLLAVIFPFIYFLSFQGKRQKQCSGAIVIFYDSSSI